MSTTVHFRGLSTDPEVRRLQDRYPDVPALRGTMIPHEHIEAIIGERRDSARYKTITDRWRRRVERETGVVISGVGEAVGVGFRVLTDAEQVLFGVSQRVSAGRRIHRWHTVVANTDPSKLQPSQRNIRDFEIAAAAKLHLAMTEVRSALPARTAPPKPQPRRLPSGGV